MPVPLKFAARSIVIFSRSRFSKSTRGKEARKVVRGLSESSRMRCGSSRRWRKSHAVLMPANEPPTIIIVFETIRTTSNPPLQPGPRFALHLGVELVRCVVEPRVEMIGHASLRVAGAQFVEACFHAIQIEQAVFRAVDDEQRRWHGQ